MQIKKTLLLILVGIVQFNLHPSFASNTILKKTRKSVSFHEPNSHKQKCFPISDLSSKSLFSEGSSTSLNDSTFNNLTNSTSSLQILGHEKPSSVHTTNAPDFLIMDDSIADEVVSSDDEVVSSDYEVVSSDDDFYELEEKEFSLVKEPTSDVFDSLEAEYIETIKESYSLESQIQTTLKILDRLQRSHPDYEEKPKIDSFDPQDSSDESDLFDENDGIIKNIQWQAKFNKPLKMDIEKKINKYSQKIELLQKKEMLIKTKLIEIRAKLEDEVSKQKLQAKKKKEEAMEENTKQLLGPVVVVALSAGSLVALTYKEFSKSLTKDKQLTIREYLNKYVAFIIKKIKKDKDKKCLGVLFGTIIIEGFLLYKTLKPILFNCSTSY